MTRNEFNTFFNALTDEAQAILVNDYIINSNSDYAPSTAYEKCIELMSNFNDFFGCFNQLEIAELISETINNGYHFSTDDKFIYWGLYDDMHSFSSWSELVNMNDLADWFISVKMS